MTTTTTTTLPLAPPEVVAAEAQLQQAFEARLNVDGAGLQLERMADVLIKLAINELVLTALGHRGTARP